MRDYIKYQKIKEIKVFGYFKNKIKYSKYLAG
jgi:hypothetical protein